MNTREGLFRAVNQMTPGGEEVYALYLGSVQLSQVVLIDVDRWEAVEFLIESARSSGLFEAELKRLEPENPKVVEWVPIPDCPVCRGSGKASTVVEIWGSSLPVEATCECVERHEFLKGDIYVFAVKAARRAAEWLRRAGPHSRCSPGDTGRAS